MRETLEAALPDAVFTGVLDRDGVADACASSDMFLFPSRTDTAGNVVLEAQASGLPVLATNAGGPQENVVDGESGLCLGCYRKLSEVAAWTRFTDAERDAILAELPDRRSLIRPEMLGLF